MFTEDMGAKRLPALRLRQGRRRGRGLRPRLRPPPPRRRGHHAARRQRRSARTSTQPDHVVLPAAGDPDRARLRPAAAVPARGRPARRARSTPSLAEVPGTFNVAGDGVLMLSQAVRRLGRPVAPAARLRASAALGSVLRQARLADFSPEQLGFLTYGRGIDTTRMRADARLRARATPPREAFADFAAARCRRPSSGCRARRSTGSPAVRAAAPSVGGAPWVTPRSSRSAPAAGPAAAPGSSKPSSAARSLAAAGAEAGAGRADGRRDAEPDAPTPRRRRPRPPSRPTAAEPPAAEPRRRAPRRAAGDADDRGPPGGIPAGDWLAALQHAAQRGLRRRAGSRSSPSSWRSCAAG